MTHGRIALIGSLVVAVVLIGALVTRSLPPAAAGGATPSPRIAGVATVRPASTADGPSPVAAATPTPAPSPTARPSARPTGTAAPVARTPAPSATLDPRVAYSAFLARLGDDRTTAADQEERLVRAVDAGDQAAARAVAVDILQFADGERDWLLAHPPAECYAPAQAAAGAMVEAYGTVADRAIDWADAAPGLAALDALSKILAAGSDARDALAGLTGALAETTCLG